MGCLTGCYLIVKGHPSGKELLPLMIRAFEFCTKCDDVVPGVNPVNCGNYILHDLNMARYEAKQYLDILKTNPCFEYPTSQKIETEKGQIFYDS